MQIRKKPPKRQSVPNPADHDGPSVRTLQRTLFWNRKRFVQYNAFRKRLFAELSPNDHETILYLLPWLLSINEPGCPGFIPDLKRQFRVYGIDFEKEIRKREREFKRRFGVRKSGTMMAPKAEYLVIDGLYTIGSVGSVSQTRGSDCDIWVAIDATAFDRNSWQQLDQKINLIRDWLDANTRLPVYFFICDVTAIRECRFGSVDAESSGSTQQNVLKEEFYRSMMVILGKIPLWWISFDPSGAIGYEQARAAVADENFGEYDIIDFGDIERVEKSEYFGAALWQLNKSLSRPLKSIIKMSLLKMLLESPGERLLCHRFREKVLSTADPEQFPDFSIFTMAAIAENYRKTRPDQLRFFAECLYIRSEFNPYNRNQRVKNRLAMPFFKPFGISKERQAYLRRAESWRFHEQVELGDRLFRRMLQLYREISAEQDGVAGESDRRDLTILGRKISAFYLKKEHKIPVLQKPTGSLNVPSISLSMADDTWRAYSGNDTGDPLIANPDILPVIAFVVWNDLFAANKVRMRPNPSSVTLKEVLNLGERIRQAFGTYETHDVDYGNYLQAEFITRMLVVVGLGKSPWFKEKLDFGVIYSNCWAELFALRFPTADAFDAFILNARRQARPIHTDFYVQRNNSTYEKAIERTKVLLRKSIDRA